MAKTITQKVVFKNTTPQQLYELYMNAKKHTTVTGWPTKISNKEGTKFDSGNKFITGKNLQLVKNKLIAQTWRGADWNKDDLDSVFLLTFEQKGKDAILNMVHANIPDKHAANIKKGWDTYYWNRWKLHLAGKPLPKASM